MRSDMFIKGPCLATMRRIATGKPGTMERKVLELSRQEKVMAWTRERGVAGDMVRRALRIRGMAHLQCLLKSYEILFLFLPRD